jgi:drug/metabolite transporter (DMT)-like permease
MPMSASSVLNQMAAIFIFVLAAVFLKEPVTRRRVAALVLAVSGAVVATLPG